MESANSRRLPNQDNRLLTVLEGWQSFPLSYTQKQVLILSQSGPGWNLLHSENLSHNGLMKKHSNALQADNQTHGLRAPTVLCGA